MFIRAEMPFLTAVHVLGRGMTKGRQTMSHLALYREWRPQTFDEVVSQKQVVYPLKQAILNGDIGHAYLFSGTRGTGKTSLAKIFAKAVNCLNPQNGNPCNECSVCQGINKGTLLDVMEIDAASNNSVDNIRRITDEIVFMPTEARYKVYIIDEVHMLSQGAFNALLKTLEEPPEHAIFILATTEPQRIPATILSRCQRFEFRRIALEEVTAHLRHIADSCGILVSDEALVCIARLGDGAMRDSISLLDQCRSGIEGAIEKDDVLRLAGMVRDEFLYDFTEALLQKDLPRLLTLVEDLQMSGRNMKQFLQDFIRYLRDLLVCKVSGRAGSMLTLLQSEADGLKHLAGLISGPALMSLIARMSKLNNELRYAGDPRTALEIALISEIAGREAAAVPLPAPAANVSAAAAPAAPAVPAAPAAPAAPATPAMPVKTEQLVPEAGAVKPVESVKSADAAKPVEAAKAADSAKAAAPVTPAVPAKPAEPAATAMPLKTAKAHTPAAFKNEAAHATPKSSAAPEPELAPELSKAAAPGPEEIPLPEPPMWEDEPDFASAFDRPSPARPDPASDFAVPKPAPQTKVPAAQPKASDGPRQPLGRELWRAALDIIRGQFRMDIVMLLNPAKVYADGHHVILYFTSNLREHCLTIRRADNIALIENALRKAGMEHTALSVELEGELPEGSAVDTENADNLNDDEPEWVKKLRRASEAFGLELTIEERKNEDEA